MDLLGALAVFILVSSAAYSGVGQPAGLVNLHRLFPLNQNVEIQALRARDGARHTRIFPGVRGAVEYSLGGGPDPVKGGLYLARVMLGTPPREYNLQIDTGSDITWVTCSSTPVLADGLTSYNVSESSTAELVSCKNQICKSIHQRKFSGCSTHTHQCTYSIQYGDGTRALGFYVWDILHFNMLLGNAELTRSSTFTFFGCSTYESEGLANSNGVADGVFGLGRQSLSTVSQLASQRISPNIFSHCLKGATSGRSNSSGILVFGEILDPNMVYSPLVPSQPHYYLELQSIAVNGKLLPIDPTVFARSSYQRTLIDSGTTLAYLTEEAYEPFVMAVTDIVNKTCASIILSDEIQCYLVSTSISDVFPPMNLNFAGGATMVLRPEHYLLYNGNDGSNYDKWCIGIQKVQRQGQIILGDLILKDKIIVYDLVRQRIGWANYDCSSPFNVSLPFNESQPGNSSPRNTIFGLMSLAGLVMQALVTARILLSV